METAPNNDTCNFLGLIYMVSLIIFSLTPLAQLAQQVTVDPANVNSKDIVQWLVLAFLAGKAIIEWVYGPSRADRVEKEANRFDEAVEKLRQKASDDADEAIKQFSRLEVTVAEHGKDIAYQREEIRRLQEKMDRFSLGMHS